MMEAIPILRAVAAFALIGMAGVQISGGAARYVCDCSGVPVWTVQEHCHDDGAGHGPVGHGGAGHRHHDDQCRDVPPGPGSHHHHHELTQTPAPVPAFSPAAANVPPPRLSVLFWVDAAAGLPSVSQRADTPLEPPGDVGALPALPLLVARSVVFLI